MSPAARKRIVAAQKARWAKWRNSQAAKQPRVSPLRSVVADCDTQRLFLPDQHEQPLAPRDARVDQVSLQQHVVLRGERDHDCWELRSLRLVDTGGTKWQAERLRNVSVENAQKEFRHAGRISCICDSSSCSDRVCKTLARTRGSFPHVRAPQRVSIAGQPEHKPGWRPPVPRSGPQLGASRVAFRPSSQAWPEKSANTDEPTAAQYYPGKVRN